MNKTSFMSRDEIAAVGFGFIAEDAQVSRFARFYNPERMVIADHCRIDDFAIMSGTITLKGYNHVCAGAQIFGNAGVSVGRHAQICAGSLILSESDDTSGFYMSAPMYPPELRRVERQNVMIGECAFLGVRAVIIPGGGLDTGAVAGACALVTKHVPAWEVWAGVPAKFIKRRASARCSVIADDESLAP